ncbi:hypothetical protein CY34DRAFT_677176 [Suillus luteus UH-Slu-Lm8-n1]|uniref:Uncharacterized protein n=1 Tax=Suillus luteus UH-Slu-Lm8-n1 TaxID=930992 RepID=A0A0D0BC69_9AGAM|nr:hypothetical protein CY34DRAFT_677176 [Suillus luteus UH-Slu-Lm8-n1]
MRVWVCLYAVRLCCQSLSLHDTTHYIPLGWTLYQLTMLPSMTLFVIHYMSVVLIFAPSFPAPHESNVPCPIYSWLLGLRSNHWRGGI